LTDIFEQPRRKADRRTRVAVRIEDWPEDDRRRWLATFVVSDLFDESGAGAPLSARSRKGLEDIYGTWLGFLRKYDPTALELAAWLRSGITPTRWRPQKQQAGLAGSPPDPLVRSGDPARGNATGSKAHPTCPRYRMVVLATSPQAAAREAHIKLRSQL
jgi:hypothetical protein